MLLSFRNDLSPVLKKHACLNLSFRSKVPDAISKCTDSKKATLLTGRKGRGGWALLDTGTGELYTFDDINSIKYIHFDFSPSPGKEEAFMLT